MGTAAHIRITTRDAASPVSVLHRFDGDTLGEELRAFGAAVTAGAIEVTPFTPAAFAAAWRNHQDQAQRDIHARLPRVGDRDIEILERFLAASIEVHPEDLAFADLGLEYWYTVVLDEDRVVLVADHADNQSGGTGLED